MNREGALIGGSWDEPETGTVDLAQHLKRNHGDGDGSKVLTRDPGRPFDSCKDTWYYINDISFI